MRTLQDTPTPDDFYLPYEFVDRDGERVVKIFCDPPQIMTASELYSWMKEIRNESPLLYSHSVHIYMLLRKGV